MKKGFMARLRAMFGIRSEAERKQEEEMAEAYVAHEAADARLQDIEAKEAEEAWKQEDARIRAEWAKEEARILKDMETND